jgi:hypothetical protein
MDRATNSALLPSMIAGLAVLGGVIGYQIGNAGEGDAPPTATAPAEAAPAAPAGQAVDWSQVSEQDLEIASLFVLARDRNAATALDSLSALADRDSTVWRRGHAIAHTIGRFVIRHADHDPAVLSTCRPTFQAGCYHGVMEGYMRAVPSVEADALTRLCADLESPGTAEISPRECAHGLGHGLLERVGYDINLALGACDRFAVDALRGECHDGVFMQNVVRGRGLPTAGAEAQQVAGAHEHQATGAHEHGAAEMSALMAGESFRADDLAFPCNRVDAQYQPACWSYQPVAIARFKLDRGEPTLDGCELAPAESRARCYSGYGKQSTVWTTLDEATMIETCSLAPAPHDVECLAGVVESLVDRSWGPELALSFCAQVESTRGSAEPCYETLGGRIALLHAEPRATEGECALAREPRLVAACLRGAGRR